MARRRRLSRPSRTCKQVRVSGSNYPSIGPSWAMAAEFEEVYEIVEELQECLVQAGQVIADRSFCHSRGRSSTALVV